MKILYAIQGTGNGHISRARDIIPELMQKGEVDILISGTEAEVELPFPVKYRFHGLSFVFGKNGGIDLLATYRKGNIKRLYDEIQMLPVDDYDLIINDFEPVSAWACKLSNKQCIGLSHQGAVVNKKAPKPVKKDVVGKAILKFYAPVTMQFGFHFENYDVNIFTPVIRNEIRNMPPLTLEHYTVYLPAYSDNRILKILTQIPGIYWHVFSKNAKEKYVRDNIEVHPINNSFFIQSLATCTGVLCGAGFETPAEALFLNKKLLVLPMKGQYEQQCNAAALNKLGIPVLKNLKNKQLDKINDWTQLNRSVGISYPDCTSHIIEEIFRYYFSTPVTIIEPGNIPASLKKFRTMNLEKILKHITN